LTTALNYILKYIKIENKYFKLLKYFTIKRTEKNVFAYFGSNKLSLGMN